MENNNIYDIIKSNGCIDGGTYEAYIKVREVILNSFDGGHKLVILSDNVTVAEFIESVKVLMTFASKHKDERVELYECDMSCKHFKMRPCPGDCMLSDKSVKRCPFYAEKFGEER